MDLVTSLESGTDARRVVLRRRRVLPLLLGGAVALVSTDWRSSGPTRSLVRWSPRLAQAQADEERYADPNGYAVAVAAADASFDERAAADFICDGVEDNVELEAARDLLAAAGGGVLLLSSGTFDLGENRVVFRDMPGITVQGAGMDATIVRNDTALEFDSEPLTYNHSDYCCVFDLTVSGGGPPRPSADGLDFDDSDFVRIERVRIARSRGRGIVFDGKDEGQQQAIGNIVRDCVVTGCAATGIELLAADRCRIIDCEVSGNGEHGLKINRDPTSGQRSHSNRIVGGRFDGNRVDGIVVIESYTTRIEGAMCRDNGRSGIRIETLEGGLDDARGNEILDCVCTNLADFRTQRYGVELVAFAPGEVSATVVRGNDLRGNVLAGLREEGSVGTTVEDNAV